jgi:hypothetical protein
MGRVEADPAVAIVVGECDLAKGLRWPGGDPSEPG